VTAVNSLSCPRKQKQSDIQNDSTTMQITKQKMMEFMTYMYLYK
jgi:hypothetical protein